MIWGSYSELSRRFIPLIFIPERVASINNQAMVKDTMRHGEAFVREYLAHCAKRSLDPWILHMLGNSSPCYDRTDFHRCFALGGLGKVAPHNILETLPFSLNHAKRQLDMRWPIENQYQCFHFEKELLRNGSDSGYHSLQGKYWSLHARLIAPEWSHRCMPARYCAPPPPTESTAAATNSYIFSQNLSKTVYLFGNGCLLSNIQCVYEHGYQCIYNIHSYIISTVCVLIFYKCVQI